ncbi:MAG TPA: hypothetical protein VLI06_00120 [Solimonas sp.]|nr:hypothetical protein [Solimonas sp.]
MPAPRPRLAVLLLSALALAGSGCAQQPERPPVALGSTQTLAVGDALRYDDGLGLRLQKIEDSRCRQGMICVWAGELAPVFELRGGLAGEPPVELRMGTGTARAKQQGRYRFVLLQVTPEAATFTLTRP